MISLKALLRLQKHLYSLTQKERRTVPQRLVLKFGSIYLKSALARRHGAYVEPRTRIGENVDFRHEMLGVFIAGLAEIGDDCVIYHHVTIGAHRRPGHPREAPKIGNRVFIGANATIIGRCVIGDDVRIGAGVTLVNATIPSGSLIINKSAFNSTTGEPVYGQ
ncbi:MAG: hypothetical protein H2043_06375 [Rhizobiales bacterium]|nr:hypothetical protein [Hyphomicrobiales bacterium]